MFPTAERAVVLMADATGAAARALGAAGTYRDSLYDAQGFGAGVVLVDGYDQLTLQLVFGGNAPTSWECYISFSNDNSVWTPETAENEVAGAVDHPYMVRTPPLDATQPDPTEDDGPGIPVIVGGWKFCKLRLKHTGGDGTQTCLGTGRLSAKR